jgi:L-alanine-DL-glutamate epimerase-like enolase superfamily enzyme
MYADTSGTSDADRMGRRLRERREQGFTFLKMDVSINLLEGVKGTLTYPRGQGVQPFHRRGVRDPFHLVPHPFTGIRVTDKGLDQIKEYVGRVRDVVGWDIPLAADHFGHIGIEDAIKLARALDPFNLAWLEDMVPWFYVDQYVRLTNACTTPILTGEDIYLKEDFLRLFEKKAISICHPDLMTSGGLLETKKIGDLATEHGISMAMHMAGSPVGLFGSLHCAAATENFLVLEHHDVDTRHYDDLVEGVPKPIVQRGFVTVPDGPGLGITLNEEAIAEHLRHDGLDPKDILFPPSDHWNEEKSWDRTWS